MHDDLIEGGIQLLWLIITIVFIWLLAGCKTVKHWDVSEHQDMMLMCRAACGKHLMQSYEPMTGTCECTRSPGVTHVLDR